MLVTWKEEQNLVLNKLVTDITDLKLQCTTIQKSNSDIQEAMIYINKDYEEMRNKVELLGKEHEEYTKYINERLETTVRDGSAHSRIIKNLEKKIDALEQQARRFAISRFVKSLKGAAKT
ncbi:unnamed protein product [Arctia plantaginis]|uniref:Uncharacterized protein n=1 Tax=Arctia plantaginis TaxID=874455 RepID=A0A8S1APL1_ARCPL|nr:unnamed protein product [Arctia plantaginis]